MHLRRRQSQPGSEVLPYPSKNQLFLPPPPPRRLPPPVTNFESSATLVGPQKVLRVLPTTISHPLLHPLIFPPRLPTFNPSRVPTNDTFLPNRTATAFSLSLLPFVSPLFFLRFLKSCYMAKADLYLSVLFLAVRPTNFWRHTPKSALTSPLSSPASILLRRSSLINTGDAGSDECTEREDLLLRCESLGKVWGERVKVKEMLI